MTCCEVYTSFSQWLLGSSVVKRPGGEVTTFIQCQDKELVELYLRSSIYLHGVRRKN